MSRVQPSISAPAAPRTCAAVESNSPHGAMRAGLEQANTGISSLARLSISAISSSYGLVPAS